MNELYLEIQAFQKQFLEGVSQATIDVIFKTTKELVDSGIADKALGVGAEFPSMKLNNAVGENRNLAEIFSNGPTIVNYYRGAWCPYCNLELAAYQKNLEKIQSLGAQLVAISPQGPDESLSLSEKHALKFDVLTDKDQHLAKALGIHFDLAKDLQSIYQEFGINLDKESWSLPLPATYIVDTQGRITYAFKHADYTQRAEPAEVIASLEKQIATTPEIVD